MKQFFFGLVTCCLVAGLPVQSANMAAAQVEATAVSNTDEAVPAATSDSSFCLDSMETVPGDDLVPTPASADGGCSTSADTIST
jgi:hypothetical protein